MIRVRGTFSPACTAWHAVRGGECACPSVVTDFGVQHHLLGEIGWVQADDGYAMLGEPQDYVVSGDVKRVVRMRTVMAQPSRWRAWC